ncbi:fasciclin-2-like [Mytilus californianus]|uniref:fasciclin-2-like n=1 Tax=Mytilus californianus TaxID=6549 RepID=UPI002247E068|nr:fasciclin-2-like [Mytilus californianus]
MSIQVRQGHYVQLKCQDKSEENEHAEMTWLFNGMLLQNDSNKVVIEQINPDRSGEYTCIIRNKAGTDYEAVNITVTYFPIVRCENVTFNDSDKLRTLECEVSGAPNMYNFSWFHYSYHNQLIRMFTNTNNKTLTLPIRDYNDLWYEDIGIYICNVTNGIPDDSGNLWQTGKIAVKIEGIPVLVNPKKYKHIGHFGETSSISISVFSSSKGLKADWYDERQIHLDNRSCVPSVNEAETFGEIISVSSFECEYVIKNTTEDDFQNYTVRVTNHYGQNAFNISLVSARVPDEPTNIRLHSTTNQIRVEFKPGFNGGSAQKILIEYRKASAGPWISLEIRNLCKPYVIQNLKPNTEYELRMYAINKLGNSTVTDIYRKFTKDETNGSSTQYLSFAIGFVFLAGLFVTWLRFRKAKRIDAPRSIPNEQQIQGVGVIVNNMYGSAVDPSASASREDVYSSIERHRQNLDIQEVTYKIAGEGKTKKFRRTDRKERNRNNERGSSKLNYIDVVFEPKPCIGKFYIHGADNRTPYADVDFSAKAEPLISSDEDDIRSINRKDNGDDFVSLEDVQQWNITED